MTEQVQSEMATIRTLDDDFQRARRGVLRRSADAPQFVATVQQRIAALSERLELLAALMELSTGGEEVRQRLAARVEEVERRVSSDTEAALDIALGMFAVGRTADAVRLLGSAGVARLSQADMALVASWLNQLSQIRRSSWGREAGRATNGQPEPSAPQPPGGPVTAASDRPGVLGKLRASFDEPGPDVQHAAILAQLGKPVEALEVLDRVIGNSGSPVGLLRRAELLHRLGRHDEALGDLEALPPAVQAYADTQVLRIRILTALGRTDEALEVGRTASSGFSSDVALWLAHTRALAAAGDGDQAMAEVRAMKEAGHTTIGVLVLEGELLLARGRLAEALKVQRAAVQQEPGNADGRAALARTLAENNDHAGALDELSRAVAAHPFRTDLLLEQVRLLLEAGQSFAAADALDRAQQHGAAGHVVAALRGATYESMSRYDEAASWYERALIQVGEGSAAARRYAENLERVADNLADAAEYGTALTAVNALRDTGHLSPSGRDLRAELLRMTMRFSESLQQTDEVVAGVTGAPSTRVLGTRAQVLVELSRSEQALAVVEEALRQDAQYHFGHSVRVSALSALDHCTSALEELDRTFPVTQTPAVWYGWASTARASLLARLARHQDALEVLKSALMNVEDPELHCSFGFMCNRLGEYDQAIAQLREAGIPHAPPDASTWAFIELADALISSGQPHGGEPTEIYRLVLRTVGEPTPTKVAYQGWAAFGLGDVEGALERYETAFAIAIDPLTDHRARFLAIRQAISGTPKPVPELDSFLSLAATGNDPRRERGLLNEARYVAEVLKAFSPAGLIRGGMEPLLAALSERLNVS